MSQKRKLFTSCMIILCVLCLCMYIVQRYSISRQVELRAALLNHCRADVYQAFGAMGMGEPDLPRAMAVIESYLQNGNVGHLGYNVRKVSVPNAPRGLMVSIHIVREEKALNVTIVDAVEGGGFVCVKGERPQYVDEIRNDYMDGDYIAILRN